MRFSKLSISDEIKDNLEALGFIRTTDIQFKTIPAIMKGEDVLAVAQTGTGKTAAFAVPVIDSIHTEKPGRKSQFIRCLVLVPTRELAKQIGQVVAQLSRHTRATSYAVYGGVDQDPQISQLVGGVDILIATPGRMFDLIHQEYIDVSHVKILVLDEADHMLDLGFINDINSIKSKLTQRHQTLFFSATINPKIKKLAYSQIRANALRIQVSPEKLVSRNVSHFVVKVPMDDKRHLLTNFITLNPKLKTIVFVRTQVRVGRVLAHLQKKSINAIVLHGGLTQDEREHNLETFRDLDSGVLLATDLSARGIDVSGITHVINYDLPDEAENYVHRIGRTGRGFAKGDAITFCSPEEQVKLDAIEEFIQTKISELDMDQTLLNDLPTIEEIEEMDVQDILALEESYYQKPSKKQKKPKKKK